MEVDMISLIIFDADNTLVDRATGDFLPGVREYLDLLNHPGCRNRPALAIATNQGGPACHDAGWGEHYPTLARVEARYGELAEQVGGRLYMSLLYLGKKGDAYVPAGIHPADLRLRSDWRKPEPGMLHQAMLDAGAAPAAGCAFQWAQKFFSRGWQPGQDWGLHR